MLRVASVLAGLAALGLAGCSTGGTEPSARRSATGVPSADTVVHPKLPEPVPFTSARSVALRSLQTARLDLDSPDWMTVASGSLWVKLDGGSVVQVDPETARVRAEVPAEGPDPFQLCQGFGSTGDAVWSCTPYGTLQRIDATSARVTDNPPITMRSDQGHLVSSGGRLWLITRAADTVAGIDLRDLSLGPEVRLGVNCTELAAAGRVLWAACPADGQVVRLDTSTRKVTGRLALPDPRQLAAGKDLWVGFQGGVAQVDPVTLAVTAVYDVHPGLGGSVSVGAQRVWVRCDGGPFLVAIDPIARRVDLEVTARGLPSGGEVVLVGRQLWATAYDDRTLVRLRPPAA